MNAILNSFTLDQANKKNKMLKQLLNSKAELYIKFIYKKEWSGIRSWEDYVVKFAFNRESWEKNYKKYLSLKKSWGNFITYKDCPVNYQRKIKTKREIKFLQARWYCDYHKLPIEKSPEWLTKTLKNYGDRIKKRLKDAKEKKYKNKQKNEKMDCCICLENLTKNDMIKSKYCSHSICYKCYGKALQGGNPILKCPLCREDFGDMPWENENNYN